MHSNALSPVQIRKFGELTALQWHQVLTLRSAAFVVDQQCIYPDPDATDLEAIHVFMTEGPTIISYARFFRKQAWHIGRVVTHRDYRSKGVASLVLRSILDTLTNGDTPQIELSAQVYLTPYYSRFGFHIQGSMYLEDGIPHVRMVYQRT